MTAAIDLGGSTMSNTSHIGTAASAQPTTNPPAARRGSESQSPQASPGGRIVQSPPASIGQTRKALAGSPAGSVDHAVAQRADDGERSRPPRHRREPGSSTPRSGRSHRQKIGAVLAALALVVSTVNPVAAHQSTDWIGWDCPHRAASEHDSGVHGSYTVNIRKRPGWNDRRCLHSEIYVRGFNINGEGEGWSTKRHSGSPGIHATWAAEDVIWVRHRVVAQYINGSSGSISTWQYH